ncbi:MAG: serine protease, partial [Tetrasphaera sp.]|nr:serine protease [Tetrasphaera sp.]
MQRTRFYAAGAAAAIAASGLAVAATAGTASAAPTAELAAAGSYVVLAREGADAQAIADRLAAGGARITSVNTDIGLISLDTTSSTFVDDTSRMDG